MGFVKLIRLENHLSQLLDIKVDLVTKKALKLHIGKRILQEVQYVWREKGLKSDKKTQYAIIRCLEVTGEAAKKIPDKSRNNYPAIPWQEISGMRDKLIHDYFGVDLETVWDTIQEDLLPLKKAVENLLKELS